MTAATMNFSTGEKRVIVKNTFLTVVEQNERRGSSSVPPSLRLVAGDCFAGGARVRCSSRDALAKVVASDVASDASGDIKSTESGGSAVLETPTDAEISEAEVASVSSAGPFMTYECAACLPTSQVSLNPRARAWTPGETMTFEPVHVQMQVSAIAAAVQGAMTSAGPVLQTQVFKLPQGWQVTAEVQPHELGQRERLLKAAKEAMLSAAELSSSMYVLGYKWRPFLADPLGFTATLCDVQDDKACCWGYLENGTCRFEGRCRWQHPVHQTIVNVAVVPAEMY